MLSRRTGLLVALAVLAPQAALAQGKGIWSDKALDQHKFPSGSGPESLQRKPTASERREDKAAQKAGQQSSAPRSASIAPSPPSAGSSGGVRKVEMPPRPGEIRKVEMPARPEVRKIEGPRRAGL